MFHCNSVSILEAKMIDGMFINNSRRPQQKFEESSLMMEKGITNTSMKVIRRHMLEEYIYRFDDF